MNCFQRFITLAPFSSVRYERREIVRSGVLCQLSFCKEFGLIGHLIFTLTFNLHGPPHLPKFKFPPLSPFLAHLPLSFFFCFLASHFHPISLALSSCLYQVSADFIQSGKFTLERMGVTYKAKAHLKSPFDPENKRVKGIYA